MDPSKSATGGDNYIFLDELRSRNIVININ